MKRNIKDLEIPDFINSRVLNIIFSEYFFSIKFYPSGTLEVDGYWELKDCDGKLVDRAVSLKNRDFLKIHKLIGLKLTKIEKESSSKKILHFEQKYQLSVLHEANISELTKSAVNLKNFLRSATIQD